ncbi:MAG: aminopeptidase N [Propionibacteriaceae bacterium]|jgi:aminopeptidase N|nr:aminopeptidase N [Propionibacteriaceae bacterium]
MAMTANITRAEAAQRSKAVRTSEYQIEIDVTGSQTPEAGWFHSTTRLRFEQLEAGRCHADLIAAQVLRLELDGAPLPADAHHDCRVWFEAGAGSHELLVEAWMRYSHTGEGLHKLTDPADGRDYLYTQFEPADARRVYACFEQPDLKASFQLTVLAPAGWTVLSNSPAPAPEPLDDTAFARFAFAPTKTLSTYLTALVAGPFHAVHDEYAGRGQRVPLGLYCRESLAPYLDAERIFATTKAGFAVYEANFGVDYAFGKYDQVFVPEFNAGAMENAGCVTFRDDYLFRSKMTKASYEARDNTILHEMAHMWFGDLVTMRWWDDLWLNESFAEWASHWCQAEIRRSQPDRDDPWATFANARKNWAYKADQLPTTHPIAADMVDLDAVQLNFDGITYAKGASTLKQLVAFVGQDAFLAGLRQYFARHAWGNTTFDDLLDALAESSGRDLSQFAQTWLQSTGVNTLRAEFELDQAGRFTKFAVRQSGGQPRQHRLAIGLYGPAEAAAGQAASEARLVRLGRVETDIAGDHTEIPELVGLPRPSLLLLNDDDLTYAKIRLDDVSVATLKRSLRLVDDTLARALCWGAAWDMCRDGELGASDYVQIVLGAVRDEDDLTAVQTVLNQSRLAIDFYAAERRELAERFADAALEYAKSAAPGSDHQLEFFRAFVRGLLPGSPQTDFLRACLEGRDGLDGLVFDADLRWRMVRTLARLGVFADADIDAEAERDNTAQGRERAAGARACQPTAQAKAAAWELAVIRDDTPNETHFEVCSSFWQLDQDDVLADYADRYFALAEAISAGRDGWSERSFAIREHVLRLLFPDTAMDAQRLAAAGQWFESAPLTPPVRRPVAEELDAARRALRARSAGH